MRPTLILLLAGTLAAADPKPGDGGTPEHRKALDLVRQLGDPKFANREAAATRLIEMGRAAVPALTEGTRSGDEEVRTRSLALLPRAKAAEWARRAAAYLADADSKQEHDLPLRKEWDKAIGKPDAASRELFAEIVRANGEFLEQVASDREKATQACAARCQAVLDRVRTPKGQNQAGLGDLAAVLFVDTLHPAPPGEPTATLPADLLQNPALTDALGGTKGTPALGRLLVRWVEAQPTNDPTGRIAFADLARQKPFPEAVPALVKLANDRTRNRLVQRLLAIQALGAVGGKEAHTALAALVPNRSAMFAGDPWSEFHEGDSALAASLVMHGKKPQDYELIAAPMKFVHPAGRDGIPMSIYGFRNSDARVKAIGRWKAEVAGAAADKDKE